MAVDFIVRVDGRNLEEEIPFSCVDMGYFEVRGTHPKRNNFACSLSVPPSCSLQSVRTTCDKHSEASFDVYYLGNFCTKNSCAL